MHDHNNPPSDEKSWDEFYQSHDALWSGNANPQLVAEISSLPPRTALDAGCGEGGDAIWLAQHGWQVTGMDFAHTALRRAADNAVKVDPELANRISWTQADLTAWQPNRQFDLVTSHFMHLPTNLREPVFAALAAAVAPGGRCSSSGTIRRTCRRRSDDRTCLTGTSPPRTSPTPSTQRNGRSSSPNHGAESSRVTTRSLISQTPCCGPSASPRRNRLRR